MYRYSPSNTVHYFDLLKFSGATEVDRRLSAVCQLQTNVVSGLVFLWVIALPVLFGYVLMHNLDSPTRFEKSKDDDGR